MTDCLIIGFSELPWKDYEALVRSMGEQSPTYRDLALAFTRFNGEPRRALDVINYYHPSRAPLHNADFMWPVVLYLSTYLSRNDFTYDYVNLFHLQKDVLREKLLHDDILTIAVTTTLYVIPQPIIEIIEFIRKYNCKAKIIVGGPFISNQRAALNAAETEALFSMMGADIYVNHQEGESTLVKLLTALKAGQPLNNLPNLAYKEEGRYVFTQSEPESNSLEANPVNYSLFSREEIGEFLSIRTAKSCPFSCSFCGFPERAGRYTYLSVPSVEKELDAIRRLTDVTTITFLDDTFNVPKARFKELLRMMIKNQYHFRWNCFYRCDHGDFETIKLMQEAGCEGVFLGIESGSDSMLQRMNKGARRKDYLAAIPALKDAGITIYASFIAGFPGETISTIEETVDLIDKTGPDFFRLQLWYCDPATPIWRQREQFGVKGHGFGWSHDTMDCRTACDLIEKYFTTIDSSVWLPQYGFEHWSLYYLQRKGMPMADLKRFLRAFNNMIRYDLTRGEDLEAYAPPVTELRQVAMESWAGIFRRNGSDPGDVPPY